MNLKFNFNWIAKFLCVAGCLYQSVEISKIYFSYQTTTNVRYERNNNIELPGISICTSKFKKYQNITDQVYRNLTIGQLFSRMEDNLSLLYYCTAIGKNKMLSPCPNVNKQSRYIDDQYFCFTIFSQLNKEPDDNYLVHESASNQQFLITMLITVPKIYMDFTKLIMQNRKEILYQSSAKGELNLKNSKSLTITYQKTIVKYLFNPKRNCFVGLTYDSCLSECRIREYNDKTGKYPGIQLEC